VLEVGHGPLLWTVLAAAVIFVVAAVTDALDGFLARRWRVISQFGRVMDPFADKLLVLGAFVLLAGPGFWVPRSSLGSSYSGPLQVTGVEPWMAVVILSRELLITSLRGALESSGVDFSATASGKLKMVLQSACVPVILLIVGAGNPFAELSRQIITALVWTTVLITCWSGLVYVARAIRVKRGPDSP
jgi:CDP-diacylglycerol--glycerol-3-phosphate 3-phosphatidyltransferase